MVESAGAPGVLITSGAYVSPEIAAEFGRIPPAFLPIGNRRLYQRQVEEIRRALPIAPIFLSVPADFELEAADCDALALLGVAIMPAPPEMSLGEAVTYAVLSAGLANAPLVLLHGDTLLSDYPLERADAVGVGATRTYYPWADVSESQGRLSFPDAAGEAVERRVLTGAFHFADTPLFLRALAHNRGRFIQAVAEYSEARPLACVEEGRWLDFGHLHTLFRSRRQVTTEREFNRLESEAEFFVKSSANTVKIRAEQRWFESLPENLRTYTPSVQPHPSPDGMAAYRIEYCYLAPLSDLYVFGRLPPSVWRSVFEACSSFLAAAARHRSAEDVDAAALYRTKTLARLEQFAAETGMPIEAEWRIDGRPTPSLVQIAETCADRIGPVSPERRTVVHGDFCFSNILFDFRTQRIKVIDPRGLDAQGRPSIHGDGRYETAKLHHSVVGQYDHIIAGRCRVARTAETALALALPTSPQIQAVQQLFLRTAFAGRMLEEERAAEGAVLLFLSMLPLHSDDPARQLALLANALRLYRTLEESRGA